MSCLNFIYYLQTEKQETINSPNLFEIESIDTDKLFVIDIYLLFPYIKKNVYFRFLTKEFSEHNEYSWIDLSLDHQVIPINENIVIFKVIEIPHEISILNFPINRNVKVDLIEQKLDKLKTESSTKKVNILFQKRLRNINSQEKIDKKIIKKSHVPNHSVKKKKLNRTIHENQLKNLDNTLHNKKSIIKCNDKATIRKNILDIMKLKLFLNNILNSKSVTIKQLSEYENNGILSECSIRISNGNIVPRKIKEILEINGNDDENPREYHYIFYNYLARNIEECEHIINISPIFGVNIALPNILEKNLYWDNLLDQF